MLWTAIFGIVGYGGLYFVYSGRIVEGAILVAVAVWSYLWAME